MRPSRQTVSDASGGAKYSTPVVMDYYGRPEVSLQVETTGTVNWTVQQTLDNVLDPTITPVWFPHPDPGMVSQTGNAQGNYAYIPAAVRIVLNSGTGSVTFLVLQAGLHP